MFYCSWVSADIADHHKFELVQLLSYFSTVDKLVTTRALAVNCTCLLIWLGATTYFLYDLSKEMINIPVSEFFG